ncbi:MAG: hypothetical protein Q9179_007557 [Wetmoreana sp. 5 TL-2023]
MPGPPVSERGLRKRSSTMMSRADDRKRFKATLKPATTAVVGVEKEKQPAVEKYDPTVENIEIEVGESAGQHYPLTEKRIEEMKDEVRKRKNAQEAKWRVWEPYEHARANVVKEQAEKSLEATIRSSVGGSIKIRIWDWVQGLT